jgi:hypothetical protein
VTKSEQDPVDQLKEIIDDTSGLRVIEDEGASLIRLMMPHLYRRSRMHRGSGPIVEPPERKLLRTDERQGGGGS